MVSARRFASDEPALFKSTVDFIRHFSKVPDPVVAVSSRESDVSAKIAWTLLGTTLFQGIDYPAFVSVLSALQKQFPGDRLWNLPVPSVKEIQSCAESALEGYEWKLLPDVPGIFWSVGLFVRRHGNMLEWLNSRTPEGIWRDLGEIYFVGKGNPRPKACAAIYRLLIPAPIGLGLGCASPKCPAPLPLTMGARRFLAMLGPARDDSFADLEPEKKQKMLDDYCKILSPDCPYVAAHALQFYLEWGKNDFICRESTCRCAKCPLYEHCNNAVRHD